MITANVFRRTFFIKFGQSTGTAFTVDAENKQYLVTARHVWKGIKEGESINIFCKSVWRQEPIRIVGLGEEKRIDTDVAVFALKNQLSPSLSLSATSADLIWGQDVYFLGYPYGLYTSVDVNDGYPLALVKRALVSGSIGEKPNPEVFLLDGHNNPGFSGGPVVFRPRSDPKQDFRIMAIVSAYRTEDVEVKFQGEKTGLTSATNTGIVVCPSIKQVMDMIAVRPIGAALDQK